MKKEDKIMKKALTAGILVLFLVTVFIPVISYAGARHPVHRRGYSHSLSIRIYPFPTPYYYRYSYPRPYPYPYSYPYSYSEVKVLNGLPYRIEIRGEFPEISMEPGEQVQMNISLPYGATVALTATVFDGDTVIGTATHQVRASQREILWHITYFNRMRR